MPDSGPDTVDRLIAASQDSLRDLRSYDHHDRRLRLRVAGVQSRNALAAAVNNLAGAVRALATTEGEHDVP